MFTKGKSLMDPMMLAAMPTFEEFDGCLPQTGYRFMFLTVIKVYAKQVEQHALNKLGNVGATVAHRCIPEAVSFVNCVMTWIYTTHAELQKVSPGAGVNNWKYVCHCVRVVFEVIHDAR